MIVGRTFAQDEQVAAAPPPPGTSEPTKAKRVNRYKPAADLNFDPTIANLLSPRQAPFWC